MYFPFGGQSLLELSSPCAALFIAHSLVCKLYIAHAVNKTYTHIHAVNVGYILNYPAQSTAAAPISITHLLILRSCF